MLPVRNTIQISYNTTSFPRAAATATGTTIAFTSESVANELVQNGALGELQTVSPLYLTNTLVSGGELADVVRKRYGDIDYEWGISSASTDFVSRTKMAC